MNKLITALVAGLLSAGVASAQQALFGAQPLVSPQINADGTVTFRYTNPKAIKVEVTGDFLPTRKVTFNNFSMDAPGMAEMTQNKKGVWEYTTSEAVKPEMYTYTFVVNGTSTIDPSNMWVNRDVASLTSVLLVPGSSNDTPNLYAIHNVPHGSVSKVWYHSDEEGINRRLSVYTPAGYFDKANASKRYPVVYILHGIGGDEDAWLTQGRAAQILDNLIASGKAEPMIAVFTNGNIAMEAAPLENSQNYTIPTMALPKTMDGTFEPTFVPEVVKFIDTHFRTIAKKQDRAICGLSMGGFHSLYIAINNPDSFNYVGMFSAAIGTGSENKATSDVYKNLYQKVDAFFAKKPALWYIGIGKADFLYAANKDFRAKLDDAGHPYHYTETEGGHIWRNWRIYLSEYLPMLFK